MSEAREWLVQWLRDAHAMEEQAETMLNGQLSRIENYPELSARIRLHLQETREHAARLNTCLKGLGEDTSTMKDAGGKLMAMAQSLSGVFAGDEVMKGSLATYTFEHMEIASYTILVAAAQALGEKRGGAGLRAKSARGRGDGGVAHGPHPWYDAAVSDARGFRRRQR
jgi:ferritin-like metal-binding protein YciE